MFEKALCAGRRKAKAFQKTGKQLSPPQTLLKYHFLLNTISHHQRNICPQRRGEMSKSLKPFPSLVFPVSSGCIVVSISSFYEQRQNGHFHLKKKPTNTKELENEAGAGIWSEAISL